MTLGGVKVWEREFQQKASDPWDPESECDLNCLKPLPQLGIKV